MKKHDEGYTLPFVLVILTILYFVVSIVLTSAETTVTAQQQSVAQMKQKYAAQGKIEMLVGQLCEEATLEDTENKTDKDNISKYCSEKIKSICDSINGTEEKPKEKIVHLMGDDNVEVYTQKGALSEFTCTFTISCVYHSVQIEGEMILTGKVSKKTTEQLGVTATTYSFTDLSVAYDSYQRSEVTPHDQPEK